MNKEKLVPVDMKIGELIDAMNEGRCFRLKGGDMGVIFDKLVHPADVRTHPNCFDVYCMGLSVLERNLYEGNLVEEVEMTWQECLDGSWENGQWCKVASEGFSSYLKITAESDWRFFSNKIVIPKFGNTFTPCSEELSTMLETEGESL